LVLKIKDMTCFGRKTITGKGYEKSNPDSGSSGRKGEGVIFEWNHPSVLKANEK
jgi:hypothetical protein